MLESNLTERRTILRSTMFNHIIMMSMEFILVLLLITILSSIARYLTMVSPVFSCTTLLITMSSIIHRHIIIVDMESDLQMDQIEMQWIICWSTTIRLESTVILRPKKMCWITLWYTIIVPSGFLSKILLEIFWTTWICTTTRLGSKSWTTLWIILITVSFDYLIIQQTL